MTLETRADRYVEADTPLAWSAVFGGAAVSVAVSLLLTVLAAGFGYALAPGALASRGSLAGFSPEVGAGAVAAQVVSAALGGYLAGRLRPAWTAHGDEAHFRDTAHGLVAWAVSTLAVALLAAAVLTPYAEAMGSAGSSSAPASAHASDITAQSSFFIAIGMLLSAFTAAVAGRLGGMRTEEMAARGLA